MTNLASGTNGPLPSQLQAISAAESFPNFRHRWNTNEELASLLIAFDKHVEWLCWEMQQLPASGSMFLFHKKKIPFRRDGYCWKRRKDGKTMREDHMKLKVNGIECIYGSYVHSAIIPTFHRRCYWLLQNQNIALVHYLNVPLKDDNKLSMPTFTNQSEGGCWTPEELAAQIRPMLSGPVPESPHMSVSQLSEDTIKSLVDELVRRQVCTCTSVKCRCTVSSDQCTISLPVRPIVQHQYVKTNKQRPLSVKTLTSPASADQQQPLILNLSQLQGTNGLLILSSSNFTAPRSDHTSILVPSQSQVDLMSRGRASSEPLHSESGFSDFPENTDAQATPQVKLVKADSTVANLHVANSSSNLPSQLASQLQQPSLIQSASADVMPVDSSSLSELTIKDESMLLENSSSSTLLSDMANQSPTNDLLNRGELCSDLCSDDELVRTLQANMPQSDSLDMLELELYSNAAEEKRCKDCSISCKNSASEAVITDFSPEWAYIDHPTKVLVTGPWFSTTSKYSILFGEECCSATLVQSGVLRCLSPVRKDSGKVDLRVSCEGQVVSSYCQFDYRSREDPDPEMLKDPAQWFDVGDDILRQTAIDRIQLLEKRLVEGVPLQSSGTHGLEARLCEYVQQMSLRAWKSHATCIKDGNSMSCSLLHLAAALGYTQLIISLIKWRSQCPSLVLDCEVDALGLDGKACSPLLWACARGQLQAAHVLCQWNSAALSLASCEGLLPIQVAESRGFLVLVEQLRDAMKPSRSSSDVSLGLTVEIPQPPLNCRGIKSRSHRQLRLAQRISIEVLPDHSKPLMTKNVAQSEDAPHCVHSLRSVNSDPHLNAHFSQQCDEVNNSMDTMDDLALSQIESPLSAFDFDTQIQMMTLASQIIAALPERIKSDSPGSPMEQGEEKGRTTLEPPPLRRHRSSSTPPCCHEDSGISTPLENLSFDEYRLPGEILEAEETPSHSPSSSCVPSPYSFCMDLPAPTTQEFTEYFNAPTTYMQRDFSRLTLSDEEQRKLYEAACIIQDLFRQFCDKQQQKAAEKAHQDRQIQAAVLIQSYYRRYKQYAYYKKMTQAAVLIQSQFRSYYAQKRFKRSRQAATLIQNQYRTYREHERFKRSRNAAVIIQQRFRTHYQRKRLQQERARRLQAAIKAGSPHSLEVGDCCDEACRHSEHAGWPGSSIAVSNLVRSDSVRTVDLSRSDSTKSSGYLSRTGSTKSSLSRTDSARSISSLSRFNSSVNSSASSRSDSLVDEISQGDNIAFVPTQSRGIVD